MFPTAYLLQQALSEVNKQTSTFNTQLTLTPSASWACPPCPRAWSSRDARPLPRRDGHESGWLGRTHPPSSSSSSPPLADEIPASSRPCPYSIPGKQADEVFPEPRLSPQAVSPRSKWLIGVNLCLLPRQLPRLQSRVTSGPVYAAAAAQQCDRGCSSSGAALGSLLLILGPVSHFLCVSSVRKGRTQSISRPPCSGRLEGGMGKGLLCLGSEMEVSSRSSCREGAALAQGSLSLSWGQPGASLPALGAAAPAKAA